MQKNTSINKFVIELPFAQVNGIYKTLKYNQMSRNALIEQREFGSKPPVVSGSREQTHVAVCLSLKTFHIYELFIYKNSTICGGQFTVVQNHKYVM